MPANNIIPYETQLHPPTIFKQQPNPAKVNAPLRGANAPQREQAVMAYAKPAEALEDSFY